jgi:hypothetical protein
MAPDELSIALTQYNSATSALNSLWSVFSGIALAVIGYAWGGRSNLDGRGKLALGTGFLVFAVASLQSVVWAQEERVAALGVVRAAAPGTAPFQTMLAALHANPVIRVGAFHSLLSLGVLLGLYLAHRRDRHSANP